MNFHGMLRFLLSLCGFINLPVTGPPILLEGDGTLIAENDIVKAIATLDDALSVLQPLRFVGISYQLTVGRPLQSPTLLLATSSDCGGTYDNSILRQLLSDLVATRLIVVPHLLIYKSFCFCR